MEAGTWIALAAMVISLFAAAIKYIDRAQAKRKEKLELAKKQANIDVERDSIVVRGAEGALLLMERTLKTSNEECEKRIGELEEENEDLRCEVKELRQELHQLRIELKDLTNRVRRVE